MFVFSLLLFCSPWTNSLLDKDLYEWWNTGPQYLRLCLSSRVHWFTLWKWVSVHTHYILHSTCLWVGCVAILSPLSNHLFIWYDCSFLPRPVVHIPSVSLMFVLLTSVDCVAKVCLNGGAQDSTTCDCLCLPNYTGYMCESECLIECVVIHLRIQNMQ